MCRISGQAPIAPTFAVRAADRRAHRATTSASRARRALVVGNARVHAAREPRQRRACSGGSRGSSPEAPSSTSGDVDWAGVATPYFLDRGLPRSAERRAHALRRAGARQARRRRRSTSIPSRCRPARARRASTAATSGRRRSSGSRRSHRRRASSIDLGWSFVQPMTRAFGWLLAVLHSFVPNYGVVDHPAHDPRARRDGAADREADALDGAHAPAPAEDQGDPGEVRGRSPEAVRGDDEPLPAGEGESARRLPADVAAAARLHRVCSTRCAARSSSARRRSSAGSTISPRPICCSRSRASTSRCACCRC